MLTCCFYFCHSVPKLDHLRRLSRLRIANRGRGPAPPGVPPPPLRTLVRLGSNTCRTCAG
nr:MAG TPA: hypothetical protein [Caudoviricetes sp.]